MKAPYEPMTSLLFRTAVSQVGRDVVLDIGANKGHFTLIAARLRKHVIAFEPRPSIFAQLNFNLVGHGPCYTLDTRAVSDRVGEATLYYAPERKCTASLKPLVWRTTEEIVKTTTIDDVLRNHVSAPYAGVIKIDVEGAEPEVIAGGADTIRLGRPVIFIEILNDDIARDVAANLTTQYDFYRIYEDEMRVQQQQSLTVGQGWGNFMLLPSN